MDYNVKENLRSVLNDLPEGVKLVAVSKYHPAEYIMEAYEQGHRIFGESHEQEIRQKFDVLPKDIEWHFIGHLQGKQLKYYIQFVSLIHGVDSIEHLEEVEHAAAKVGRTVDVLLQLHVAKEETKFGFLPEEIEALDNLEDLKHVRICGVMGMASNTDDMERVRADFHRIREIFDHLRSGFFAGKVEFRVLSMGMSHDYPIAIEEGSTLIRLGTSIFGPRDYCKKP